MINYIQSLQGLKYNKNCILIKITNVHSKKDLFKRYNEQLKFPFFSENWDSFYDLLSDLYWIQQNRVVIIHDNIEKINKDDFLIYKEIILEAFYHNYSSQNKQVDVYFSEKKLL